VLRESTTCACFGSTKYCIFRVSLYPLMARFSAVASDSSSDEEEIKNDEQEIVSSSSEDERRPAARGSKLSAIDEDDEDYEEDSSEENDEDETGSSSGSYSDEDSESSSAMVEDELARFTPSRDETRRGARDLRSGSRPVDTSVIPWAQRVGVDAQKMHVMQSSLFRMPEEAAAMKAAVAATQSKPKSRMRLALTRKHSRDSDGDTHMAAREVGCGTFRSRF
jgi:nuclear pore complex protein Nup98-Nup96